MKPILIIKTFITSLGLFLLLKPIQASAQIVPQPWVSVGAKDGDVTYAVGAKALSLGVELGTGEDGATGVDVLKFINLPIISPYFGVGYYSEDKGVAFSGGVQTNATKNIFLGGGYHSVRGVNGQIGIKF
jgi:hypothetical protein